MAVLNWKVTVADPPAGTLNGFWALSATATPPSETVTVTGATFALSRFWTVTLAVALAPLAAWYGLTSNCEMNTPDDALTTVASSAMRRNIARIGRAMINLPKFFNRSVTSGSQIQSDSTYHSGHNRSLSKNTPFFMVDGQLSLSHTRWHY